MSKINFSKEQLHIIKPNTTSLKKTDVPPSLSNLSSPSGKTPISIFSNKQEGILTEITSPGTNRLSFHTSAKFTSPGAPLEIIDLDDKLTSCTVKSQRSKPINELISNEVKTQLTIELSKMKMEMIETITRSLRSYERDNERNEKIVKRNEESLKCFREEVEEFRAMLKALSNGESNKVNQDQLKMHIEESQQELRRLVGTTTAQMDEKVSKEISSLNKHFTYNILQSNNLELKKQLADWKVDIDENLEREVGSLRKLVGSGNPNQSEVKSLMADMRSRIEESFGKEISQLNSHISLLQANFEESTNLNQIFEEKIEAKLAESSKIIISLHEKNERNSHLIEERYKSCLAISASIEEKMDRQIIPTFQKKIKEITESVEGFEKKGVVDGQFNKVFESLKQKVNIDDLTKIQTVIDGGLRENFIKYDEKIMFLSGHLEILQSETEKVKKLELDTLPKLNDFIESSRFQALQTVWETKQTLEKKFEEQSVYMNERQKGLDTLITNFINSNNSMKNDFMDKLLNGRQEANKQIEELFKRTRNLEETVTQLKLNDSAVRELNSSSSNTSRVSRHLNMSAEGTRRGNNSGSRANQLKELKEALKSSQQEVRANTESVFQGIPPLENIKKIECKQIPPSQDISMRSLKDELKSHNENLKFTNPLLNKSEENSIQVENFVNNSCSSTEKCQSVASETTHAMKYNEYLQKYEQFSRDIDNYLLSRKISPNNYLSNKGSSSKKNNEDYEHHNVPEVKLNDFAITSTLPSQMMDVTREKMNRNSFRDVDHFERLSPWNLKREDQGKNADVSILSVDGGEDTSTHQIKQFASQNKLGIAAKMMSTDKRASINSSILSQSHLSNVNSVGHSIHKIFEIPQRVNPLKVSDLIKVSNTIGSGCEHAADKKTSELFGAPDVRMEPIKGEVPTTFKKKDDVIDQESEEVEYQLDEYGYILDENGNYILDDQGNYVQLSKEHMEYLKSNDALEEKFI